MDEDDLTEEQLMEEIKIIEEQKNEEERELKT